MVQQEAEKSNSFFHYIKKTPVYLVSACLIGLRTRYDAIVKSSDKCLSFLEGAVWIPVCPEQLGGLSTPRTPADLIGGDGFDVIQGRARVVARDGLDVTDSFLLGANQVLEIAKAQKVQAVLLKSKSPSCGLTPQAGVTAALLKQHDIEVVEF